MAQVAVQTVLHTGLRRGDAEAVDPTLQRLLGRPGRTLEEYVRESTATCGSGHRDDENARQRAKRPGSEAQPAAKERLASASWTTRG